MKVKVIFQKTETDYMTAWVETKTIEIDIPEKLRDYHIVGGMTEDEEETK